MLISGKCSSPVWTEWRAGLCGPVWTRDVAVTPQQSACPSASKSQSVPLQLAGPQGFLSVSGVRLRKGPGGYRSYAELSNLRTPTWDKKKKEIPSWTLSAELMSTLINLQIFTVLHLKKIYRNELHNLFKDNLASFPDEGPVVTALVMVVNGLRVTTEYVCKSTHVCVYA